MSRLIVASLGVLMFWSNAPVEAQKIVTSIYPIHMPQGLVLEGLSGYGPANCTFNSANNIGSSNPASLADFDRLSVGISEQFESDIRTAWIAGVGYRRSRPFIPQSAGMVVPYGKWRFGAGFSQRYNSIMDFSDMLVTSVEQPEGTGETFKASNETNIQSYSLLSDAAWPPDQAWTMNLGARISLDRMSYNSKIWKSSLRAIDYSMSWSAGLRYDLHVDSVYLKLGMFFEKGPRFMTRGTTSGMDLQMDMDVDPNVVSNNPSIQIKPYEWPVEAKMPSRLHMGLAAGSPKNILVLFDYSRVFLSGTIEGFPDTDEMSGSVAARFLPWMTASIGFMSTERTGSYWQSYPFGIPGNGSLLFLTAGLILRFHGFETEFAYAGSRNSETFEWYRQNILKLGMNYHL
jgi:hypothetical protein